MSSFSHEIRQVVRITAWDGDVASGFDLVEALGNTPANVDHFSSPEALFKRLIKNYSAVLKARRVDAAKLFAHMDGDLHKDAKLISKKLLEAGFDDDVLSVFFCFVVDADNTEMGCFVVEDIDLDFGPELYRNIYGGITLLHHRD